MAAPRLPPPPPVASIDFGALASLPSLPVRARFLVDCFLTGRHRSPFKGSSPEFAEYRGYQTGDDVRQIDWRLYARSDRLAVKQFEDESQLRIWLALDLSASLRYASRSGLLTKFDFARTVLAATALLARRQNDAVGLALIGKADERGGGEICDVLRPGTSPAHHAALFNRLDAPPLTRAAAVESALHRLAAVLPRGSLLVIASDFYADLPELAGALHVLRSQRVDVIGLQVLDPMEVEFAGNLAGRFVDLETGAALPLNSAACREGYLERFGNFRRELADAFRRHEADLTVLRTDENPLAALAAYFAHRSRRV